MLLVLSHFSHVRLCATPWMTAHQAPRPWDSPGKNTGVGCHFLLQCMKVKSESEVSQSCLTLHDPMDSSLPGSSVHRIFQARVLEWGTIAFSIVTSVVSDSVLPHRLQPTRLLRPWDFPGKSTGVGRHCLLQMLLQPPINKNISY